MFLFREFTLTEKKETRALLKQIYGLGWSKVTNLLNLLGLARPYFSNNLNEYYINIILYLLKCLVLSDTRIKRIIDNNINNLLINNSYKGTRHLLMLPVRGQRTRTNSQTQRRKRSMI